MTSCAELGRPVVFCTRAKLFVRFAVKNLHQAVRENITEMHLFGKRLRAAGDRVTVPRDIKIVPGKGAITKAPGRANIDRRDRNMFFFRP